MIQAIRGGVGLVCLRLASTPIQNKRLDEDRLNYPVLRDPNSGIDRVLKIFNRDENDGSISPEASFISMVGFTGAYIGAIYGGILESKRANMNFRETTEAVLYQSRREAQRELQNSTTVGFGKGVFRWGIRYGIFCTSFTAFSTIISTFRGDTGILEYSLGGLLSGSLYRFSLGPKGMISGGFFGTVLGTFCGAIIYLSSKMTGVKMQDIYINTQVYFKVKDKNFHGSERHGDEPDIIRECFHPYGVEMSNSLDSLEDIKDLSELKFNKNRIPITKNVDCGAKIK
ncbi:RPII140-upstream gene protein [Contarinia nasturtii]|uniref:RPII140-upstream gene protein n=1 Tax=Contarinia nasturtii TaxID=265458 RepID=UPI0012D4A7A0|nr:RPII140-upstream gene protein [Contarinia nasturtii]